MNAQVDRLTVRRSQPVQGQPVDVLVDWNGQFIGELRLPFTGWLKFKRLLEKGIEGDARENYALQVKLSIQGIPQTEPLIDPQPRIPNAVIAGKTEATDREDQDADPDIEAVEREEHDERIRSARLATQR